MNLARSSFSLAGLLFGLALGCGSEPRTDDMDCIVGSHYCMCTPGGGCDPNLDCIDGLCLDPNGTSTTGATNPTTTTNGTNPTTSTTGDTDSYDVGNGSATQTGGDCTETGCKKVDILFAVDSSLSMTEEINALAASQAASEVVAKLGAINCGGIDYRIGLTNDNDGGWIGSGQDPWWASETKSAAEISAAFSAVLGTVLGNGGTAIGCEHVLSSAADLLSSDTTSFVRDDALLVLVLLTDVDDYGFYDHTSFGGPCAGFLCTQTGSTVQTIYDNLVALKGGDASGLATVVLAGDPNIMEGLNTCQQPATCCGVGLGECAQAHHAPRLWEFASLQTGTNGVAANICDGAEMIPTIVQNALDNEIDLACQGFTPPG